MNNRSIVVVEDDHFDRELIGKMLQSKFPNYQATFFSTESEFRTGFPSLAQNPPAAVILDIRMPWAAVRSRSDDIPLPPPDVEAGTYREAGLRCWKVLRQNDSTKNVPVIFYTILDERPSMGEEVKVDARTEFLSKGDDDYNIIAALRRALARR